MNAIVNAQHLRFLQQGKSKRKEKTKAQSNVTTDSDTTEESDLPPPKVTVLPISKAMYEKLVRKCTKRGPVYMNYSLNPRRKSCITVSQVRICALLAIHTITNL